MFMQSDMDKIMKEHSIDALWVTGPADHNPNMVYYTGLRHVSGADLIKAYGKPPTLFHNPMEREEAAKTGLQTCNLADFSYKAYLEKSNGDVLKANTLMNAAILKEAGITSGRISVSGRNDVGSSFSQFSALQEYLPEIQIVGQLDDNVFDLSRLTKSAAEIERIRQVGLLTVEIVGMTAEYLSHLREVNGVLVGKEGMPVTIGDIKKMIRLWFAERNLEAPEETIFAIGRDAGIPHSAGNPSDVIRTGTPIVFDIFPCEAGGGYYYDFTRTWCFGYAPDDVLILHEEVHQVYDTIVSELRINQLFSDSQDRTCQLFAEMGHVTFKENPQSEEGYVHSIGHGVGLAVHEKPFSGISASAHDILKPGVVFTIEPGLYYPARNMGVRLEDTYYATEKGEFKVFVDYPFDLVIPLRK
jgi:Xaa-Pro aminopeptidase